MTVTIDLNAVPVACWWYGAGTLYLLLCYLWWGPIIIRHMDLPKGDGIDAVMTTLVWVILSPLAMAIGLAALVSKFVMWRIYGREKQ